MSPIIPVPKNTKASCHNHYCLVALTSVIMKCFERLVMAHLNSIIPDTLDPVQFAYRPSRSIGNPISIALHTALTHLDKRNAYVRMLVIDYSSAFNSKLVTKLRTEHLQLEPGIPDEPTPGGVGRQHQLHHADPQHGGPTGVCA